MWGAVAATALRDSYVIPTWFLRLKLGLPTLPSRKHGLMLVILISSKWQYEGRPRSPFHGLETRPGWPWNLEPRTSKYSPSQCHYPQLVSSPCNGPSRLHTSFQAISCMSQAGASCTITKLTGSASLSKKWSRTIRLRLLVENEPQTERALCGQR
jgi:hypothetical protein